MMRVETLRRSVLGWVAAAVLLHVAPVEAAPITYTDTMIATGVLGSLAFTNAQVTITLTSDTSSVSGSPGSLQTNIGAATLEVAGLGSATFTNTIWVFNNSSLVAMSDVTQDREIFGTVNAAFVAYDLRTAIGPVTGIISADYGVQFPTTAGSFSLISATAPSAFTAVTPEPASGALACVIAACALFARRRA